MNATLDLLRTRRSVAPHLLSEPGPNPEELEALLTIATRVPDHGRLTPWRFLVIEGEARARIGEVIAAAFLADQPQADATRVEQERNRLARAPTVAWAAVAAAASLVYWGIAYRKLALSPLYALTYPLGSGVLLWIVLGAIARGSRVSWKGRDYTVGMANSG